MQVFHCDHCQNLVFFENVQCVACGNALAFLPDLRMIGSLESAASGLWKSPLAGANEQGYRLCANYLEHNVCNWAVLEGDPNPLCISCRLTRVIPDLHRPGHQGAWYKLEIAKRRLVYTLQGLGLAIQSKTEDPEQGLAFEFVADPAPDPGNPDAKPLLTGHADGVITINIAEADDAERERRRLALHEPYRTLLGHFRHEVSHYYWDRLIQDTPSLTQFRELFGDERADYAAALQQHYEQGPPADWQNRFVTAYASSHPWEDWAESCAHFFHMVDTLETASASGLSLKPRRTDEPLLSNRASPQRTISFDHFIADWFSLSYVLNNLNRSQGLPDGYPFVLSTQAIEKLRFIHTLIHQPQPVGQAFSLP